MNASPNMTTVSDRDGMLLVTPTEGLFDRMPETYSSGPASAELQAEFKAGLVDQSLAVLLDIRTAGELNHRTVDAIVQFAKIVKTRGGRLAICGTDFMLQIWDVTKLKILAPMFVELSEAKRWLRVAGEDRTPPERT